MPYLTQPHHLTTQPICQTANHKATDTSNPNATSTGTVKPAGTSYGLLNGSNKRGKGGKGLGERDKGASGSVAPSSDVHHAYVIPNSTPPPLNPDEYPPPLSMVLKGEESGKLLYHSNLRFIMCHKIEKKSL
ncbi:hypothetical protein PAXRUDRAFT_146373 [Paxillus rubicundulus Ve08.2h10]|uniref:Uncharacterized protein n=1 Tax=Paxillus rubicundulus Ve08.2h10 TaxID=930991 RepID=A0A0D0DUQ4_9AGAM|nr:hypothetical protein PAXRUDRAFT_146373 [Paxillus rubicundulus Ve08.2h10]